MAEPIADNFNNESAKREGDWFIAYEGEADFRDGPFPTEQAAYDAALAAYKDDGADDECEMLILRIAKRLKLLRRTEVTVV